MGAMPYAVAAVDTDHGFVGLVIPEDTADGACEHTVATPYAPFLPEDHPSSFPPLQGPGGADLEARWIRTGPAEDDDEPPFHSARRPDAYPRFSQTRPLSARTGEHTTLAAHALVAVRYHHSAADLIHPREKLTAVHPGVKLGSEFSTALCVSQRETTFDSNIAHGTKIKHS